MSEIIQLPNKIKYPFKKEKLLLHSCCAPCTGGIIELLLHSDIKFDLFFYNPNIHPEKEYVLRKQNAKQFADKKNLNFIDAGYDPEKWFERVRLWKKIPERGKRCEKCFDIRLETTAAYAHLNGYKIFSSSCGISRWKDMHQVTQCGLNAAKDYPTLTYWDYNWRKDGGSQTMYTIAKKEKFYKQEYCGCAYSLKKENALRKSQGESSISFGQTYY